MISFKRDNEEYELEFSGIKIINTSNTTKFYKEYILESQIYVDNRKIRNEDIIYINELTKINEFINLSKKSFLFELIITKLGERKIVNINLINEIVNEINDELNFNLLDLCEGDTQKLINLFIELNNEHYLDKTKFDILIKNQFTDKKLFIIDNVSWINIIEASKYLNEHEFIILTNDFRDIVRSMRDLEIITIHNKNEFIELFDYEKVISYLENKMSEPINNEKFNDFLINKESLWSTRIFNLISNLK